MFKYKIKVVGWEYHIYRKKHWLGLWQDTGIVFTNHSDARRYIDHMNPWYTTLGSKMKCKY